MLIWNCNTRGEELARRGRTVDVDVLPGRAGRDVRNPRFWKPPASVLVVSKKILSQLEACYAEDSFHR